MGVMPSPPSLKTQGLQAWFHSVKACEKPKYIKIPSLVGGAIPILKHMSSSMGKMTSHMKWKKHVWNHQPECFILCHLGTAQEKVRSQSPHVIPCPNHLAGDLCPKVAGLATSRPTPNICPTKQLRILCRINILRRSCKHFGYTQWFKF